MPGDKTEITGFLNKCSIKNLNRYFEFDVLEFLRDVFC